MFFTADQFVAHAVGDYILQSDWMANAKTKKWLPAILHALTYTLVFVLLTTSWKALAFIFVTHAVIDHYRLARHVIWVKNFMSPPTTYTKVYSRTESEVLAHWWHPWHLCISTGYHEGKPPWLTVWLMIITDNTMHVLCNGFALYYWGAAA